MTGVRVRVTVAVLVAVLVVYFVFIIRRAIDLIEAGGAVPIGLGIGVLLLPVIGVIVVAQELRFGVAAGRLTRRWHEDGEPVEPDLPRRPSGRVDRPAADAWFETVRGQVEADPEDWRGWYTLGRAYDLAGDRRRARAALRRAIELAG